MIMCGLGLFGAVVPIDGRTKVSVRVPFVGGALVAPCRVSSPPPMNGDRRYRILIAHLWSVTNAGRIQ
jgi:hypothetical protein